MKNQELSKRRQAIYIACYLGLYPGFIFWHFLSLKISGALRAELQATLSESALRNWDVFTFVLYAVALALLISRSRISIALGSDWKTILLRVALMALTVWGIQYYFDTYGDRQISTVALLCGQCFYDLIQSIFAMFREKMFSQKAEQPEQIKD